MIILGDADTEYEMCKVSDVHVARGNNYNYKVKDVYDFISESDKISVVIKNKDVISNITDKFRMPPDKLRGSRPKNQPGDPLKPRRRSLSQSKIKSKSVADRTITTNNP